MASRQTDKYGNPAHHTGHLGAPGTTGAFETHDPLGAPGTTGASPTTGYNGQEQLHRPAAGLNTTGTTGQGYAYGTASTTGHVGHAQVATPHTAGLTGTYDTGGAGQGTHRTRGYDTGGGADIGHIGHEGRHGGGYDTSVDKGSGGGKGVGGAHGGGYDTGGDKDLVGGLDTLGQRVGEAHGQGLGGGHVASGYEAGSDWAHTQGVKEHGGGGYDTGGNKGHGQGVKEHSGSDYDAGGDWTHSQEVRREHGGEYNIGGERHSGGYDSVTCTGEQVHGGTTATVVEVVTEEPMQEEESKGFIDRIMEHLPGTAGGGGTK
ncbi:uncharacterized protein LOC141623840 [Silene latifolia]|uniref:uncharacterized protein LOC141623840 n=1 Tax=Silene latifolia TaxID=37657 RepID=UPI003D76EFFC